MDRAPRTGCCPAAPRLVGISDNSTYPSAHPVGDDRCMGLRIRTGLCPSRDSGATARRTHRGIVLAAVLLAGVLGGCTGAPDRESEAQELKQTVAAMPGVDRVHVIYSNDVSLGPNMDVSVQMDDASDDQIEAVVARIDESFRLDFAHFRRSAEFDVGVGTVKRATGDSSRQLPLDSVSTDAQAIRQIGAAIPSIDPGKSQITWVRNDIGSELTLRDVSDHAVLRVVRSAIGNDPVVVRVLPEPSTGIIWDIRYPFGAEQEDSVRAIVSKSPLRVSALTASAGHLSRMRVTTSDPDTADTDLVSIIDLVAPTHEHPLFLDWDQAQSSNSGDQRRFAGAVHVAGCGYPTKLAGEQNPGSYYTDKAIALRDQLRAKYDACPK